MWCAPDLITLQTFAVVVFSLLLFRHAASTCKHNKMLFTYAVRPCLIYDRGCIELARITRFRWNIHFGCNWSALHHLVIDIKRLWCELHAIKADACVYSHTRAHWNNRSDRIYAWTKNPEIFDHGPGTGRAFNGIGMMRDLFDRERDTNHYTRNRSTTLMAINYVQNASTKRWNEKESEFRTGRRDERIVVANGQHKFLNSKQNRCGTRTKLTHLLCCDFTCIFLVTLICRGSTKFGEWWWDAGIAGNTGGEIIRENVWTFY